jgi:hypothetical protein
MKSQANSVHDDGMFLPLFVIYDEVDEIIVWGAFQYLLYVVLSAF